MSEKTSRRSLLQNTALAAGAAALLAKKVAAQTEDQTAWKKMFPAGFRNERIKTTGAEINAVIGGSGPPLLLFHGAPDSLITWRLIAPDLSKDYTVVMCDLRGYGDSSRPEDKPDHSQQSKRPMALDGVEVMEHLGFRQFRMVGHDRGARVGRRMALDHPDRVLKLAVLDIVPAHYLYSHVTLEFARGYPHWFSYLLPPPGPENDLVAAAKRQAEQATNDVQREYLRHRVKFEMEHCMCEDYRASASVDLKIDQADIKAGKKITCPLLALWAGRGLYPRLFDDVLGIWKEEGTKVSGKPVDGSHNLQESAPKETLAELQAFLKG
ncbi:MAG TPA: alpha/beta hydrolase [Bryobacteraceae bacterium]|jgi:haloacetate dehalogenase|nr:alpha/beta hydrolase [Bryobacteraceae bacterium]